MRLKGQVAIITGGASGLGKAAVQLFVHEGAKVVIADMNREEGEKLANSLNSSGGEVLYIQTDVSDKESVDHMVKKVVDTFQQIDILVNNAGITRDSMLHKMTLEQWNQVININLSGVYHCTRAVVPYMRERGYGRIISTASVVGVYGNIGQTNYAAAKAGVIGMTKSWAKELGPKGITVNAVAPGFIQTPMTDAVPQNILQEIEQRVPLRRLGQPSDIAYAYLYLASSEASYVNGAVLQVDGGLSL